MCEMYKALSKLVCNYLKTVFFLLLYVSNLEFLGRLNYWTPNFLSPSPFLINFCANLKGPWNVNPTVILGMFGVAFPRKTNIAMHLNW